MSLAKALQIGIGTRYGRRVVVGPPSWKKIGKGSKWVLPWECACGGVGESTLQGLEAAPGCAICGNRTHTGTGTTEYAVWTDMWARCRRVTHRSYHQYGGRGISVSQEWRDFAAFLSDMGPRPGKGYTLERVDNNSGYRKSNCRWATVRENLGNRRITLMVRYLGESMPLAELARRLNIPWQRLRYRAANGLPVGPQNVTVDFYIGSDQKEVKGSSREAVQEVLEQL